MAFETVTEEKEKGKDEKNEKRKTLHVSKCKKKGHYSNECTEELPAVSDKKGTSLLINKEDSSDEEIEEEQYEEEEENNRSRQGQYCLRQQHDIR